MRAAAFLFTVNKSFLRERRITIPRSQVKYPDLLNIGLDHAALTVIFPRGERRAALIYYHEGGMFGEYYQIRPAYTFSAVPTYVELGHRLIVTLVAHGLRSFVILEYLDFKHSTDIRSAPS